MKLNKDVVRKIAAAALILSLVLFATVGAAEDGSPKKGFVLFGLSQLYDGTDQIGGGVGELLDGNQLLVDGLSTLGAALDDDIAGNLQTMKSGIDGQILPGLGSILGGISGQVVPGLRDIRAGLNDKMSPGLGQMITAIDGQMIPGLTDIHDGLKGQISPGLGLMLFKLTRTEAEDGEKGAVEGLTGIYNGLVFLISPGLGNAIGTIGEIPGTPEQPEKNPESADFTSIQNDIAFALQAANKLSDDQNKEDIIKGLTVSQGKLVVVSERLATAKGAIDIQLAPGLGLILGDVNDDMIPGLKAMKGAIDGLMVPGLAAIRDGLKGQVVPGLKEMKGGMDGQMIPGLDKLLAGFNRTEAATGESGVIEGLTKISHGLANPEFSPNPGGDPGVSDGLGLVVGGIRTDVLGGIDELKGGITEKIIPGLEKMGSGITDELQPGFTKVSLLLLGIWAVTMIILLVVGILIGRSGKAKASAGRSASA